MKMKNNRKLILEDGSVYYGSAFGCEEPVTAELVFNTSMTGYQEILSDPSYTGQAVVMTYPLIGNYGICREDFESERPHTAAMIVREYCERPSNFRCAETFSGTMKRFGIAGVSGVDTRKLTRQIREKGSCRVCIVPADEDTETVLDRLRRTELPHDQVSRVSTKKIYQVNPGRSGRHIVAIDCGMKKSIPQSLAARGCHVTVVPFDTPAADILRMSPDGVFISNGPGDPRDAGVTIVTASELVGKIPVFGICLGHQILCLAYGAQTYKLKFGHRGGNHPVKNLLTGKIEITSQNHSYAVDAESLKHTKLEATRINILDGTIEGVRCREDRMFSVQYHPAGAPGPNDSAGLFDEFLQLIK